MKKLLTIIMLTAAMCCQGQTIQEVRNEIIRQGLPHPEIVLAQARLESGNFKSTRAKRDHNILGIKHGTRYAVYARWQDCVSDYKKRISSRYKGGDYYAFLKRIRYAESKDYINRVRKIANEKK